MTIPPMPEMTEDEILTRAQGFLENDLKNMDYDDIVKALTVANYVSDNCIRVLGDRGLLDCIGDMPLIPDARPDSLFVDNVLNVRLEDRADKTKLSARERQEISDALAHDGNIKGMLSEGTEDGS